MRRINEATTTIGYELNEQYNAELKSVLIYEQLSNNARYLGFYGLAKYFKEAGIEEYMHASQFANLIQDLEVSPVIKLEMMENSAANIATFRELLDAALAHEKDITAGIDNLLRITREHHDRITEKFLTGFLDEQIEEEAKYNDILVRMTSFGNDPSVYMMIDKELGEE